MYVDRRYATVVPPSGFSIFIPNEVHGLSGFAGTIVEMVNRKMVESSLLRPITSVRSSGRVLLNRKRK